MLDMRKLVVIFILFLTQSLSAQASYTLSGEVLIFSFKTKNGKIAALSKDKNDKYIVYRFGTKDKIELEYPNEKTEDSWKKFTYSFYLRGGGIENLGMDLNYLTFVNGTYKYVLYTNYKAEAGNHENIGVKVLDSKTDKPIADIKGERATRKGTLIDFRDNELINQDEEGMLYD